MKADLTTLGDLSVLIGGLVILAVAIVGKFVGAMLGAFRSRLGRWEIVALGSGMNARGVVEIVAADVGLRLGILSTASYTIIVALAIVTSIMAPPVLRVAMRRTQQTVEEDERQAYWHGVSVTAHQPMSSTNVRLRRGLKVTRNVGREVPP
jgi:Kef-type K+ transport system membrane component KefB